jgi:DnaJ family protein B protein 11
VINLLFFSRTSCSFFGGGGGGMEEEEERIIKGDDVIVELDASLEDLYMGGSLKVTKFV